MTDSHDALNFALRSKFHSFVMKSFETVNAGREFLDNWHLRSLAWHLEQCRQGKITRLIINMPPRHLKSHCASVAFPAFILGHDPTRRIICASYEAGLASGFSRQTRQIVEANWFRSAFPNFSLSTKKNTEDEIVTTKNGFRYATSIGGPLTGKGANFLIIDDPLKASDAHSEAERSRVKNWFRETAYSRLDSKERDVIVVVAQRTHQDDLSGYLLEAGDWIHLNLPSVATVPAKIRIDDTTFRHRKTGEILHPEFESEVALQEIKKQLGSFAFAAQYQQNPIAPEGNLIKRAWVRRYQERPPLEKFTRIVHSWDTATSIADDASYSVCTVWGIDQNRYFLLKVFRERLEFPDLKRTVVRMARRWNATAVLIEKASSGQALLQSLGNEKATSFIPIPVDADKRVRVAQISAVIEAGRVYLPEEEEWLADFENEVLAFPSGKHDDQIDSMSQFLLWITQHDTQRPTVNVRVISTGHSRDRYFERTGISGLPERW